MALGALGSRVVITDLGDEVITRIESNIERNAALWVEPQAHRPVVREHAWGQDMDWLAASCFDFIVGADLLYFGGWDLMAIDTREPLLQSLTAAMSSSSQALLAWVVRHPEREEEFCRAAARRFDLCLHSAVIAPNNVAHCFDGGVGSGKPRCKWVENWRVGFDAEEVRHDVEDLRLPVEATFVCLQLWSRSDASS